MKIDKLLTCKQEEEGNVNDIPGQSDYDLSGTMQHRPTCSCKVRDCPTNGENTAIDINRVA